MNKVMPKYSIIATCALLSVTLLSGFILSSSFVSADDSAVDEINIIVPSSCNLTSTGTESHNATINNGTYATDIGTSTIKAFCNDQEGFAIYAIGYTDNTDGKNVLTSSVLGSTHDIATGTGTSGSSQWAMKLTTQTSPEPTYPITIENSFNNYHTVPDDYTLVAKRTASTDAGTNAIGSTLTSTYQVYISQTQSAGTYVGQVKYVMVHPNNTDEIPVREDQIAVIFDGNGLTFPGGTTENRVVYGETCAPMYMGASVVSKSTNLESEPNGSIENGDDYGDTVTITGADKLKVVLTYDIDPEGATSSNSTGAVYLSGNGWTTYSEYYGVGTKTIIVDGDTVDFWISVWDNPIAGHDYGYYAQVYPLYDTEQSGTEEISVCEYAPQTGTYAEPTTWGGKWYTTDNNGIRWFVDQSSIIGYISENDSSLLGSTLKVYASFPHIIYYNGNGATAGTMDGFHTTLETNTQYSVADLMAYNFKKTGYGFAGWSEDQNAIVNGSSKIYGPNERIVGSDLSFNSNKEATLYAVWVPSAGNLQGWTGCSSMASGQVTALTDIRDNNVYTVGKMQDGNCWMMENLRLDNTASLSNANTNSPASGFNALSTSSDNWCTDSDAANCINQSLININNTNIGGVNSLGTTLVVYPGALDGSISNDYETSSNSRQWYGYGNYYNWYAATAGNGVYGTYGHTSGDICPAGWALPTGGGGNDFYNLNSALGNTGGYQSGGNNSYIASNRWRSFPNNFIYAGRWHGSSVESRGVSGRYWSRTGAASNYTVYVLVLTTNSVAPGTIYHNAGVYNMIFGYSARCVLKASL